MAELRALLLTDVVDSTRLSAAIGDEAMAQVWITHDRVARDLLPPWRGREIDKTDGMLMLFDNADDAVNYALAYHRALAALPTPLKARAGLHVGPVLLRENSAADQALGAKPLEVEGLAKPTAARVMAVARGGQTLLTPEAREDLGRTALKTRSHGHWMIKGVPEPIELFEVGDEGTRFATPADGDKAYRVTRNGDWWMPVSEIPNNLPQQGNAFIGREREVDEMCALLSKARMLTLVGMGGLGKTRLSLQVAAAVMHRYPDGVWFLDLAPVRDPALVLSEAARVLELAKEPDRPLLQTISAHLRNRRVLFILDNCEHLIDSSAGLAFAIIQAAPHVDIMASSREGLHIPSEHTYPVLPLPVPKGGASLAELERSSAVQLFVERARQRKPSFALDEREAGAVADLVARLEGIPLAIELAAARVRAMTVTEINTRLKDRYKLLTGGARGLQERQQTLRALVDWSYDLLNPKEQRLLNRLAVFVGGFDLEAVESVCGGEPLDPADLLDQLESLVEKSLVMLDDGSETGRYRMLETLREYGRDKLDHAEEMLPTAIRHCEHYFAFTKDAGRGLRGPEQAAWIARIETDLDNVRAAITLAMSSALDPVLVVKFAVSLQGFWMLRGYATEGRQIVRAALELPAIQASDMAQAWAMYVGAALAGSQSAHAEAREMLETCLALRRRLNNPVEIAATLSTLSLTRLRTGDTAGAAEGEREALRIFQQLGDRFGEAIGWLHLGQIDVALGHDAKARDSLETGRAIAHAIGNAEVEAECELVLGMVSLEQADVAAARTRLDRSLAICHEARNSRGEANALWWLGRADLATGDLVTARERLGRALHAFRDFEMWDELLGCIEDHAVLARASGRPGSALRLASAATLARERLALTMPQREALRRAAWLDELQADLPAGDYDAQWTAGQAWDIDDAIRNAG
jgi:predicted ATPase/class 3 adenylate cyclase